MKQLIILILFTISIFTYILLSSIAYADVYVFPETNSNNNSNQNYTPQVIIPPDYSENYIKRPYNNPNLIEEQEELNLQKEKLNIERQAVDNYQNSSDYLNQPYFDQVYSPWPESINPPHPLNYDETQLPDLNSPY